MLGPFPNLFIPVAASLTPAVPVDPGALLRIEAIVRREDPGAPGTFVEEARRNNDGFQYWQFTSEDSGDAADNLAARIEVVDIPQRLVIGNTLPLKVAATLRRYDGFAEAAPSETVFDIAFTPRLIDVTAGEVELPVTGGEQILPVPLAGFVEGVPREPSTATPASTLALDTAAEIVPGNDYRVDVDLSWTEADGILRTVTASSSVGPLAVLSGKLFFGAIETTFTGLVNVGLTLRNWLIGAYISEYELRGEDRAAYGERLILNLAETLRARGVTACEQQKLSSYRLLYCAFPQIRESLTPEFKALMASALGETNATEARILRAASGESPFPVPVAHEFPPHSHQDEIHRSPSGKLQTPGAILVERLSYSHLELLAPIDHPLKRTFYEIECIKGGWSVRELKRQIGFLYFERSGLSKEHGALARLAHEAAEAQTPAEIIRDPFIFDFLGIPAGEALTETALEDALMRHLQRFLLELGRGFCFEARQKRLLIGGEHFFCDLVFYHRILKCHVLVELKVDHFRHEHLGQLNASLRFLGFERTRPSEFRLPAFRFQRDARPGLLAAGSHRDCPHPEPVVSGGHA